MSGWILTFLHPKSIVRAVFERKELKLIPWPFVVVVGLMIFVEREEASDLETFLLQSGV